MTELQLYSDKLLMSQIEAQKKKLSKDKDLERMQYLALLLKEQERRANLPPKVKKS